MASPVLDTVGTVVIGRNEGNRLVRCLESVFLQCSSVVYVDSGSTDGSSERAEELGALVTSLDLSIPFSAGRARNVGFASLLSSNPDIGFVQFVDGDCILSRDWLKHALGIFKDKAEVSIVCGRRREMHPGDSIYNMMCDLEWDTPVGYTGSCGGDFLVTVESFRTLGGFNDSVIAGEEPEMCYRLTKSGGKVYRTDHDMTLHDAQMHRFAQWWKRTLRSGHAYMQCLYIHRLSPNWNDAKSVGSILFWGALLPLLFLLSLSSQYFGFANLIVILYIYLIVKFYVYVRKTKRSTRFESLIYSLYTTLGKVPQVLGVLKFIYSTLASKKPKIIEYK